MVNPVSNDCAINYRTKALLHQYMVNTYHHLSTILYCHRNHSRGENVIKSALDAEILYRLYQVLSLYYKLLIGCIVLHMILWSPLHLLPQMAVSSSIKSPFIFIRNFYNHLLSSLKRIKVHKHYCKDFVLFAGGLGGLILILINQPGKGLSIQTLWYYI